MSKRYSVVLHSPYLPAERPLTRLLPEEHLPEGLPLIGRLLEGHAPRELFLGEHLC